VHCLTSGLFRKEFYNVFFCSKWRNNGRIGVVTQMVGTATQTQLELTKMKSKTNRQDCAMENVDL
jgi:hypothetical protein